MAVLSPKQAPRMPEVGGFMEPTQKPVISTQFLSWDFFKILF